MDKRPYQDKFRRAGQQDKAAPPDQKNGPRGPATPRQPDRKAPASK